jgi:lipoate-protein ligase A
MTPFLRLLPFECSDGPGNMAADEAMLEHASEHGVASLRFYTWTEPTLTLGYFQSSLDREALPNLDGLPWVRRSTGGAAILHHRELTYAVALPPESEWKSGESWICRFHRLVMDLLGERSVPARLVACGEEKKLGEVLCFLHQTPGDLVVRGCKVAGSAQRKLRSALLQHGSLLLKRSEFAPVLPGIEDLAERQLFTPDRLAQELAARLAHETRSALEPGDWSEAELKRIPEIRAEKYASPAWNSKR